MLVAILAANATASGTDLYLVLWAALGAAAITAIASLGVTTASHWLQTKRDKNNREAEAARDRIDDQRRLRDGKRERLRIAYSNMLQAARATAYGARRRRFRFDDETDEQREQIIAANLRKPMETINDSLALISLESDQTAATIFNRIWDAAIDYQSALAANRQMPGTVDDAEIQRLWQSIQDAMTELEETARRHLDELDRPI